MNSALLSNPAWRDGDWLREDVRATIIGPGLSSCLPEAERPAAYDRIAFGYDLLISNPLYHRPAWGAWPSCHADAARAALAESGPGPMLDCGCGSMVFTARTYEASCREDIIFLDRSAAMLRRAQRRRPRGLFYQGSALDLPFRDATFAAAMCWGTLHVLGTPSGLLGELRRVIRPGGKVTISTLVRSQRRIGEYMLDMLHRMGELARPETEQQVREAFAQHFTVEIGRRIGNFLFLAGRAI